MFDITCNTRYEKRHVGFCFTVKMATRKLEKAEIPLIFAVLHKKSVEEKGPF